MVQEFAYPFVRAVSPLSRPSFISRKGLGVVMEWCRGSGITPLLPPFSLLPLDPHSFFLLSPLSYPPPSLSLLLLLLLPLPLLLLLLLLLFPLLLFLTVLAC